MAYIRHRWMSHALGEWVPLSPLRTISCSWACHGFLISYFEGPQFLSRKRCLKIAIYTKLNVFLANPNNKHHHYTTHIILILKWNLSSKQCFARRIKRFFQESRKWEINACFRTLSMFSGHPNPQKLLSKCLCLELWPNCNRWLLLVWSSEDRKVVWNPDSFLKILLYTVPSSSPKKKKGEKSQ